LITLIGGILFALYYKKIQKINLIKSSRVW
jgi:hypothetical protein